jgi:major membrane immunogen (membrane-anchored lipoprotein)
VLKESSWQTFGWSADEEKMMRTISALAVGTLAVSFVLAACGSSDSNSKSGSSGSYTAVANAVEHPTGTLSSGNVVSVADAFEKIESGAAGRRLQGGSTQTQTESCPSGGSYTVTASGSNSSGTADLKYDNCCYSEGCCINGSGAFYYSTDSSTASEYSICGSYNLTVACGSDSGALNYQGSGEWIYVVTVDGKTYSVTGSYSNGSGTLTITDSKDTWTCTYTDHTGTCTGSSGSSL